MHFSWIYKFLFEILLKYIPKSPFGNKPALIQIMAWHCPGTKPLSEPVMA